MCISTIWSNLIITRKFTCFEQNEQANERENEKEKLIIRLKERMKFPKEIHMLFSAVVVLVEFFFRFERDMRRMIASQLEWHEWAAFSFYISVKCWFFFRIKCLTLFSHWKWCHCKFCEKMTYDKNERFTSSRAKGKVDQNCLINKKASARH